MQESESTSKRFESKAIDFYLQLYLILIGIGFGIGIENLFSAEITLPLFLRFIVVVLLLTIWLHGQFAIGLAEEFPGFNSWSGRMVELYFEIIGLLLLLSTAITQTNENLFYLLVLATYGFDIINETIYLRGLSTTGGKYPREIPLGRSWLIQDILAALIIGGLWFTRIKLNWLPELWGSLVLLFVVLVVSLWDYSHNRDYYFGLPPRKKTSP